jgi:FKBP-type peptidyl-prolyl cis-trans isomerase (trigger factor)
MANVVENLGKLERRVTISLPKDAVQKEVDSRIRQLAKNVRMPGFRPGKVPLKMVTQQYSGQVEAEVLSDKVGKEFFDISPLKTCAWLASRASRRRSTRQKATTLSTLPSRYIRK